MHAPSRLYSACKRFPSCITAKKEVNVWKCVRGVAVAVARREGGIVWASLPLASLPCRERQLYPLFPHLNPLPHYFFGASPSSLLRRPPVFATWMWIQCLLRGCGALELMHIRRRLFSALPPLPSFVAGKKSQHVYGFEYGRWPSGHAEGWPQALRRSGRGCGKKHRSSERLVRHHSHVPWSHR